MILLEHGFDGFILSRDVVILNEAQRSEESKLKWIARVARNDSVSSFSHLFHLSSLHQAFIALRFSAVFTFWIIASLVSPYFSKS